MRPTHRTQRSRSGSHINNTKGSPKQPQARLQDPNDPNAPEQPEAGSLPFITTAKEGGTGRQARGAKSCASLKLFPFFLTFFNYYDMHYRENFVLAFWLQQKIPSNAKRCISDKSIDNLSSLYTSL